jgi:hypothetical protein
MRLPFGRKLKKLVATRQKPVNRPGRQHVGNLVDGHRTIAGLNRDQLNISLHSRSAKPAGLVQGFTQDYVGSVDSPILPLKVFSVIGHGL